MSYSRTCLKWPLKKKTKIGFQDRMLPNAGQMYCRMLQGEHSAILSTFIKLPFVNKIFFFLFLSGRLRFYCTTDQMSFFSTREGLCHFHASIQDNHNNHISAKTIFGTVEP